MMPTRWAVPPALGVVLPVVAQVAALAHGLQIPEVVILYVVV
jgi:hypothetical protein